MAEDLRAERVARWVVGACVVAGYFAVIVFMLIRQYSGVEILIGGLAAAFGAVVQFGFGTSQGSEAKTKLLARAAPIDEDK